MIEAIAITAIIAFVFIYLCVQSYQDELLRAKQQHCENLRIKAMQFPLGSIHRVAHLNAASKIEAEFGSQSSPAK